MDQVVEGMWLVPGGSSNWVIVKDPGSSSFTLIDGGYPADYGRLLDSIRQIGLRPQDCRAALVTHGHVDHIGGLQKLATELEVPVLCHVDEVRNLVGPQREQVTIGRIVPRLWRARVRSWLRTALSLEALEPVSITPAGVFHDGETLHVPGSPTVFHFPGHTSGASAFLFETAGQRLLVSGDIAITAHETLPAETPRLRMLPSMFHHDRTQAQESLDRLMSLQPDVVLPGHGPALRLRPSHGHGVAVP